MPAKRKRRNVSPKRNTRKPPAKRKARKVPAGMVTAPQASELLSMTTSGVYGAIKRGEFPVTRHDGRILLSRADVMEGRRKRIEFYNRPKPDPRNLSDDEFLRRLWESDPD